MNSFFDCARFFSIGPNVIYPMLFNIWQHSKATMTELLAMRFDELESLEEIALDMTKKHNAEMNKS